VIFWGAHAPRVPISAPSPKCSACDQLEDIHLYNKVRDDEGVIASTRGRVRSPEHGGLETAIPWVEVRRRFALSLGDVTRF
jgi:hypothetical protein